MEAPPKPDNEIARLEALRSTELLDSGSDAIFDNLTSLVSLVFDMPVVAISLVDDVKQWFKSIKGLAVCETSREISFCGHAVYSEKPLIVNDAKIDERFFDNPLVKGTPNIVFYAGVPIRYAYQDKVYFLGTLCIIDYIKRDFSSKDLEILKQFSYQLEALIEMRLPAKKFDLLSRQLSSESHEFKDLEESISNLQEIADTDILTGLPNRRFLTRFIEETWLRDLRHNTICLMMLDLDGFKNVNDTFGHTVGDSALKDIASNLKNLIRIPQDCICRLGGDEFVIVTYNQDESSLKAMSDKILSYFRHIPEKSNSYGVSVSIGACSTSNKSHNLESLLKEADSQLYIVKSEGKDAYKIKYIN